MDTSSEYIRQCDCEEIQPDEQPTIGWFKKGIWYNGNDVWYQPDPESGDNMIKLFRQDQLQKMLGRENRLDGLIQDFYFWEHTDDSCFESMEQLWLAFVMKEKHNKIWDGESWMNNESINTMIGVNIK